MTKETEKAAECVEKEDVSPADEACQLQVTTQSQLYALILQRDKGVLTCVQERTESAPKLNDAKYKRCTTTVANAKKVLTSPSRIKPNPKNKKKTCVRESKRIRSQCAKMAKCCTVVNACIGEAPERPQIAAKNEELAKAMQLCNPALKKKGRRKNRRKNRRNQKRGG